MATFDEKEFLWEDMYDIVVSVMSKKVALEEEPSAEWLEDRRKISDFRDWIADTAYQEINYDEALAFFKTMKLKYEAMPDKW